MLLKMIGGFVLVRLLSWLMLRLPLARLASTRIFAAHALTLTVLVGLQVAVRGPLGAFSLGQTNALLPGTLIWLCFDLALRPARNPPSTS